MSIDGTKLFYILVVLLSQHHSYHTTHHIKFVLYNQKRLFHRTPLHIQSIRKHSNQLSSFQLSSSSDILNDFNNGENDFESIESDIINIASNPSDNNKQNNREETIKTEIESLIDLYLSSPSNIPIQSINPSILIENAFLLVKASYYESIMEEKLNNANTYEEVLRIEQVDNFLRRFISSERKSRSRLKLNYILAGAASERFEEAIQMLSDCNEIDNALLIYTKSLIQKEYQRVLGPTVLVNKSDSSDNKNINDNDDDDDSEEKELLRQVSTTGSQIVDVLNKIHQRLEAELKMKSNKEIRILAKLLNEKDVAERESILRSSFQRVEDIDTFEEFLSNGIDYITTSSSSSSNKSIKGRHKKVDVTNINSDDEVIQEEEEEEDLYRVNPSASSANNPTNNSNSNKNRNSKNSKQQLPIGTLERMQDIQYLLQQLKSTLITGLRESQDIYSTRAEDYISTSGSSSSNGNESNIDNNNL